MITLTPRQIHCLTQVQQIDDFIDILRSNRADIYRKMESASKTEELHALRGEARAHTEILELIADARASAERLAMSRK